MLARPFRFHGHNGVRAVYRRGKVERSSRVSLHVMANDRRQQARAAVVVSRKVNKSAVVRNRIRRRVYEHVRAQLPQLKPVELVFTIYSDEFATMPPAELAAELNSLLKRAKVIQKATIPS
jgi:ribonuclease P protein component